MSAGEHKDLVRRYYEALWNYRILDAPTLRLTLT